MRAARASHGGFATFEKPMTTLAGESSSITSIECVAETADVSRAPCTMQLTKESFTLKWGKVNLTVPYSVLTYVSYGTIKPHDPTKLVIAAKLPGGEALLKVWISSMGECEMALKMLTNEHCRPRYSCIPTILHSPFLLRFYRPWIRTVLVVLGYGYQGLLSMALFFYVSRLTRLVPDLATSLWDPLQDSQSTVIDTAVGLYGSWCSEGWLQLVACGSAVAVVGPTFVVFFLPMTLMVGAFVLAHHYLSLLMGLTLLSDVEKFVRSIKGIAKMVLMVGKGVTAAALPKPPIMDHVQTPTT